MPFSPQRVACLQPSATVTLERLGMVDRLVACTRYCCDLLPALAFGGRIIVEDSWTAEASQIMAARPDLVIASVPYQEKALAEILKAGVRLLALAPHTLADIYGDIAAIGGIMGVPARAEAVIREMQQQVEAIAATAQRSSGRPRVYCEEWGKPLIHSQPWVAELVTAAGGEFVGTPGQRTTAEAVLDMAPEVIVAAWCGAGDRVPLEKIVRERGWTSLPAVAEGRVYCIKDELLNTPAPTLVDGLRALGHAIHPELFPQPAGIRQMDRSML
ncbi:MAG: ABC transporter substrate-binding protein [Terriglobales bacterium]